MRKSLVNETSKTEEVEKPKKKEILIFLAISLIMVTLIIGVYFFFVKEKAEPMHVRQSMYSACMAKATFDKSYCEQLNEAQKQTCIDSINFADILNNEEKIEKIKDPGMQTILKAIMYKDKKLCQGVPACEAIIAEDESLCGTSNIGSTFCLNMYYEAMAHLKKDASYCEKLTNKISKATCKAYITKDEKECKKILT